MFTLAELEDVIPLVRSSVPATPQYAWPLLKALTGVEAWIGASPANTTRGIRPREAVASAVMIYVKPGPHVTEATPTLPVAR